MRFIIGGFFGVGIFFCLVNLFILIANLRTKKYKGSVSYVPLFGGLFLFLGMVIAGYGPWSILGWFFDMFYTNFLIQVLSSMRRKVG